jgi:hypothetical protein
LFFKLHLRGCAGRAGHAARTQSFNPGKSHPDLRFSSAQLASEEEGKGAGELSGGY